MTASENNENEDLLDLARDDTWDELGAERKIDDPMLNVEVEGFAGPLDLLLELSRRQKVDLAKISILALAEQYLEFIEEVRRLRIEIAADYLVMAAWLAFLKSRLLLPDEEIEEGELTGEQMAAVLAFRLKRLEAMREAGKRLVNRNRMGRDFFARGIPENTELDLKKKYSATLYDLLSAYANQRQRTSVSHVTIEKRQVWSLQEAREILISMIGDLGEWTALDKFMIAYLPSPALRATVLASSFAATLELVREGKLNIRQESAYAPIYMKKAQGSNKGAKTQHSTNGNG